jgi:hypothetical protein
MNLRLGSRFHRLLLGAVTVSLCGGALGYAMGAQVSTAGRALYDGQQALSAHVFGHDDPLPPLAARCINCHEGIGAIAPRLDAQLLLNPQARRGGPPSRYDEAAFCRLLRDGLDSAFVQLPREMPRYTIETPDCNALWTYLTRS